DPIVDGISAPTTCPRPRAQPCTNPPQPLALSRRYDPIAWDAARAFLCSSRDSRSSRRARISVLRPPITPPPAEAPQTTRAAPALREAHGARAARLPATPPPVARLPQPDRDPAMLRAQE